MLEEEKLAEKDMQIKQLKINGTTFAGKNENPHYEQENSMLKKEI